MIEWNVVVQHGQRWMSIFCTRDKEEALDEWEKYQKFFTNQRIRLEKRTIQIEVIAKNHV